MNGQLFETPGNWVMTRDGDPAALALFRRHYSKYNYKDGRRPTLFVGPGEKLVLLTKNKKGLFVWRKFIDDSGQTGVNCAVFRNEKSGIISSELIREAEEIAARRWPGCRVYTYVNPEAIKSRNPGFCYKVAGWKFCGITKKRKYLIFEKQL